MSDEEDYSKLPLADRWGHAKWKARQSAYVDAAKAVQGGDLQIAARLDDLRSAVSDPNVIALEAGVRLVSTLVLALPAQAQAVAVRRAVAGPLAEKGLSAAKPAVKQATVDAFIALIRCADAAGVVEDLLPLLGHKSPKLVASATSVVTTVFASFSGPICDPNAVMPVLPKLFAHSDKTVRANATLLAVALCRWTGEPTMLKALSALKPVQLAELQPQFAALGPLEPEFYTRQQEAHAAEPEVADREPSPPPAVALDPWDSEQPREVLAKLPGNFYALMAATKWKERNEALSLLKEKLETAPKLAQGNYNELVNALLHAVQKDANQACALLAVQNVGMLADGLRQSFEPLAPRCLEATMERFKEKKPAFSAAVRDTLNALAFKALEMRWPAILEPLLPYLAHKTPTVRVEAARYLFSVLCEADTAPKLQEMQAIAASAVKMLGDSAEPNRAAAADVLGALVRIYDMTKMGPILDTLDDHKRKKVNDAIAQITVKARAETPQPRAAPRGAQKAPSTVRTRPASTTTLAPTPRNPNGAAAAGTEGASRPPGGGARLNATNATMRPGLSASRSGAQRGVLSASGSASAAPTSAAASASHTPTQPAVPAPTPPRARVPPSRSLPQRTPRTPVASRSSIRDSFDMDCESSNDEARRLSMPSVASTPKLTKRTVRAAEFTPARPTDPKGRRLYSPAVRPSQETRVPIGTENEVDQVAKYVVLYENEQRRSRQLEQRLAALQVEKDRRIFELEQEVASLKLQCEVAAEEKRQFSLERRMRAQDPAPTGDVNNRLSTLSLSSDSLLAQSRPASRARNSMGLNTRIVPLSIQQPIEAPNFEFTRNVVNTDEYERAISMTHSLRERVAQYREMKQRGL